MLKLSEENFHIITENANDLISILNINFIHEYINEGPYLKKMGYTKKDLIGVSALKFIHPDDISKSYKS